MTNNKPLTCFDCRKAVGKFAPDTGFTVYCLRNGDKAVDITRAYHGRYMRKDCPKLKDGKGENNEA